MGVGHLDIGEGIGAAQVFNPSPAIQQYGQILAQQKAKHDAEVKQLGTELAQGYDPSGLRNDADRSAYIKQYNDIKQSAIDAENEKDNTKKALALAQVRQSLSDLGSFAEGSKKQGIFERQLAMEHLKNPYLYDDDTAQKILGGKDKVWNDPNIVKDASQVVRGVDPAKVDAEYLKHKGEIQKASPVTFDNGTLSNSQNLLGKKTATLTQRRIIPLDGDNGAFESTLHWATAYPDVQKSLQDRYPQIQGNDKQSTLALRVRKYMMDQGDGSGFVETKSKDVEGYEPDKFYAHRQYEIDHPLPAKPTFDDEQYFKKFGNYPLKGGGDNAETYRQYAIKNILSAKQGTTAPTVVPELEQIKEQVAADDRFETSTPFDYGWNKDGDLVLSIPTELGKYTGKDEDGNDTYDIKHPHQKVVIAGDGKEAKLNEIINTLTGEKVDISALETPGGKKHVQAGQQSAQKKSIKQSDIASKAAAAGYSIKEYTDLLKKNGVEIQ